MACAQTISGLAKDCEVNMGGIRKVFVAIFDDVASVTESNGQISADRKSTRLNSSHSA